MNLTEDIKKEIMNHAKEESPKESCGLLIIKKGKEVGSDDLDDYKKTKSIPKSYEPKPRGRKQAGKGKQGEERNDQKSGRNR